MMWRTSLETPMDLFDTANEGKPGLAANDSGKPIPLQRRQLEKYLAELKSDELKAFYKFLYGKTTALPKAELVRVISESLNFSTEARFGEWFNTLPELIREILCRGTFNDYVSIPVLEKEMGISLAAREKSYYSWETRWQFKPELNIGVFSIVVFYGYPFIMVPRFLREILKVWLVPPACFKLSDCQTAEQTESWNDSLSIADTLPLLSDALQSFLEGVPDINYEKLARNGFKKKEINELRASTGFLSFNMEDEYAPSAVDIAARFILCLSNFKLRRPKDGQDGIQNLVRAFFSEKTQYPKGWFFPDRAFIEYNVCIDHLSRTPGNYLENDDMLPGSRKVFGDILMYVARDGNWFDADKLAEYIRVTGKYFAFCDSYMESRLKVKAESFVFDNLTLTSDYGEEFNADGIMHYYLLERPLFKAYCYIFAALGLLEITQLTPPLVRTYRKRQYPFSVYDSLKAIRITELGRWCLGVSDKRPPKPSQEYQAIADRELLLVTVQGNSLERRVYLDRIGLRLGEDRWRISPATFISGCTNRKHIDDRIERFKSLIDPNPAPHWEQLFSKVTGRAGIFDAKRSDILIFDLPENTGIREELLRDPEFKRLVRRVEGRMLAVASRDQSKFYAMLGEHGIAHFG